MRTLFFLLSYIFLLSGIMFAGDSPPSAFKTLKHARKQVGEKAGKNLLSMKCENAKLHPREWWIRFFDTEVSLKVRAIRMIGPEMVNNVIPGNPFDGGNADYIIAPETLKYDSDKCITYMEKAAKSSGIPLHSLNILLEKPHPGEANPVWFFEWFDANNDKLGTINVSATTGKVTEVVGLHIKDPKFKSVSKKTFSEDVEDTFVGVGADLEEFFTGDRTVDKDDGDDKGRKKAD